MRQTRFTASSLLFAMSLALTGCGTGKEAAPPAEAPSETELTPPNVSIGPPTEAKGDPQPAQSGTGSPTAAPGEKKS